MAKAAGISLEKTHLKVLPGWVGEPKGLLQVLFERGLIDPAKYDPVQRRGRQKQFYTVDGRKDSFGNVMEETSLRRILGKCPDFIREETLLQFHGKAMGTIVDHSPIAHPEVAGEGVECDWGFSKLFYRRHPLAVKRSKEKFRDLVRKCISR